MGSGSELGGGARAAGLVRAAACIGRRYGGDRGVCLRDTWLQHEMVALVATRVTERGSRRGAHQGAPHPGRSAIERMWSADGLDDCDQRIGRHGFRRAAAGRSLNKWGSEELSERRAFCEIDVSIRVKDCMRFWTHCLWGCLFISSPDRLPSSNRRASNNSGGTHSTHDTRRYIAAPLTTICSTRRCVPSRWPHAPPRARHNTFAPGARIRARANGGRARAPPDAAQPCVVDPSLSRQSPWPWRRPSPAPPRCRPPCRRPARAGRRRRRSSGT